MNEGRVEQVGTPFEIYNYPRTRFVASFVGTLNIVKGKVIDPAAGRIAVVGPGDRGRAAASPHARAGETCSVALRPEAAGSRTRRHRSSPGATGSRARSRR